MGKRDKPPSRLPPPEIWVVRGVDQHGESFLWPAEHDHDTLTRATREEAERTAARLNRLGGDVAVHCEVWNPCVASYRRVVYLDPAAQARLTDLGARVGRLTPAELTELTALVRRAELLAVENAINLTAKPGNAR